MSQLVYASPGNAFFLPSQGCNQVYFNKLTAPPLALLNRGVLYELDDGKLYYNGSSISPSPIGDVSGPSSSYASAVALYNDATGQVIKNSNVVVTVQDTSTPSAYAVLEASPGDLYQLWGYNSLNDTAIGCGSALPYAQFIDTSELVSNVLLGPGTGAAVSGSAAFQFQTMIGAFAGTAMTHGIHDTFVGLSTGASTVASGGENTFIGSNAGEFATSPSNNIALGSGAGINWTGSENHNICIGNGGTIGDVETIRIGTSQTECFITGIEGVTVGSPQMVVIDPSTNQLGSQTIAGGGNVVGPVSSYDTAIALYNGTGGTVIKNSNVLVTVTPGTGNEDTAVLAVLQADAGDDPIAIWGVSDANGNCIMGPDMTTDWFSGTFGSITGTTSIGVFTMAGNVSSASTITNCTYIGSGAGGSVRNALNDVIIGAQAGSQIEYSTIGNNVIIGQQACVNLNATGSLTSGNNIVIGSGAAINWGSGTQVSNIIIGAAGAGGESNTTRIGGGRGTGLGQQTIMFLQSGDVQIDDGNLIFNTSGNKILSTYVGTTAAAGSTSFGHVTLVGGTATVATTAVTSASLVYLTRGGIGSSTALGQLTVGTVVDSTSFVITAATQASPGTPLATDVSVVNWMIVN
jgi:hypothetical protein